jgi:hypothetical protein
MYSVKWGVRRLTETFLFEFKKAPAAPHLVGWTIPFLWIWWVPTSNYFSQQRTDVQELHMANLLLSCGLWVEVGRMGSCCKNVTIPKRATPVD